MAFREAGNEEKIQDFGPFGEDHPTMRSVLMDKGYQGSA